MARARIPMAAVCFALAGAAASLGCTSATWSFAGLEHPVILGERLHVGAAAGFTVRSMGAYTGTVATSDHDPIGGPFGAGSAPAPAEPPMPTAREAAEARLASRPLTGALRLDALSASAVEIVVLLAVAIPGGDARLLRGGAAALEARGSVVDVEVRP
jgi:hypothetical protein